MANIFKCLNDKIDNMTDDEFLNYIKKMGVEVIDDEKGLISKKQLIDLEMWKIMMLDLLEEGD